MNPLGWMCDGLLDLIYPEHCEVCGVARGRRPWFRPGSRVPGLRRRDRTHLCAHCGLELCSGPVVTGTIAYPGRDDVTEPACLEVWAGSRTGPVVVDVVGALKYHGIRGIAWPLAELVAVAWRSAAAAGIGSEALVPIPLHRRRQRQRGYNQAALLAELVGRVSGLPVRAELLDRTRATEQQAKIEDRDQRLTNLAGAFVAGDPESGMQTTGVLLVDDLVTSGATAGAAAAALVRKGWRVDGILACALAAAPSVDTGNCRS